MFTLKYGTFRHTSYTFLLHFVRTRCTSSSTFVSVALVVHYCSRTNVREHTQLTLTYILYSSSATVATRQYPHLERNSFNAVRAAPLRIYDGSRTPNAIDDAQLPRMALRVSTTTPGVSYAMTSELSPWTIREESLMTVHESTMTLELS